MTTMSGQSLIDQLRIAVKPVIFDTGLRDAPVSIAGTAFLAGYREHIFLVTARHVASAHTANNLIVYPSPRLSTKIQFSHAWDAEQDPDDPDPTDVVAFRVRLDRVAKRDRRTGSLVNLNKPEVINWVSSRDTATFFAIGYPTEANFVDYDLNHVMMSQYLLSGHYVGPSKAPPSCYSIRFDNPLGLSSIRGFSGAPVFNVESTTDDKGAIPRFCGIVLRGDAQSQVFHFLPADVVLHYIKQAARSASGE